MPYTFVAYIQFDVLVVPLTSGNRDCHLYPPLDLPFHYLDCLIQSQWKMFLDLLALVAPECGGSQGKVQ